MLDSRILALALYYHYIERRRARERVNRGNRK